MNRQTDGLAEAGEAVGWGTQTRVASRYRCDRSFVQRPARAGRVDRDAGACVTTMLRHAGALRSGAAHGPARTTASSLESAH